MTSEVYDHAWFYKRDNFGLINKNMLLSAITTQNWHADIIIKPYLPAFSGSSGGLPGQRTQLQKISQLIQS